DQEVDRSADDAEYKDDGRHGEYHRKSEYRQDDIGQVASADHKLAMSEVHDLHRAVDDGEAASYDAVDHADDQAVQNCLEKQSGQVRPLNSAICACAASAW